MGRGVELGFDAIRKMIEDIITGLERRTSDDSGSRVAADLSEKNMFLEANIVDYYRKVYADLEPWQIYYMLLTNLLAAYSINEGAFTGRLAPLTKDNDGSIVWTVIKLMTTIHAALDISRQGSPFLLTEAKDLATIVDGAVQTFAKAHNLPNWAVIVALTDVLVKTEAMIEPEGDHN